MTQEEIRILEHVLVSLGELVADPECDFGPSYELMRMRQERNKRDVRMLLTREKRKELK